MRYSVADRVPKLLDAGVRAGGGQAMKSTFLVWCEGPMPGWFVGARTEGYDPARDGGIARGLLGWASNNFTSAGYVMKHEDFSTGTPTGRPGWVGYTFLPGRGTNERVYEAGEDGRPLGFGT